MHRLLIHIGYHKAASTVLQDQLFAQSSSPFLVPAEARHMLVHRFVVPEPMTFDADSARAHFAALLDAAAMQGKTAVLSHERFSGYPPSGGFDASIIAGRLHRTFPQARILVVVREQLANIASMYSQYVTDGGDLSLRDYLATPEPYLKRVPCFQDEFYCYHRLLNLYRQKFGAERVLCLPFELMIARPDEFIGQIFDFTGHPRQQVALHRQNGKRAASFQLVQRMMNRHFSGNELLQRRRSAPNRIHRQFGTLSRYLSPGLTAWADRWLERRMIQQIKARFEGRFSESNAILSRMIDRDLGEFGYQMPQPTSAAQVRVPDDRQPAAPRDMLLTC